MIKNFPNLASHGFLGRFYIVIICMALTGCASQIDQGQNKEDTTEVSKLNGPENLGHLEHLPECAVLLDTEAPVELARYKNAVEETLARHLGQVLNRVIDTTERHDIELTNALDLRHDDDKASLSAITACPYFIQSRIVGPGETYLILWSQVKFGLEISLMSASDQRTVWRARNIKDRSAGGVPFSPVGFIMNAYSSGEFHAKRDITVSVIEDLVRDLIQDFRIKVSRCSSDRGC